MPVIVKTVFRNTIKLTTHFIVGDHYDTIGKATLPGVRSAFINETIGLLFKDASPTDFQRGDLLFN